MYSLLALDDIVAIVCHPETIPKVKEAYVDFLNHYYIDIEAEMKEIYSSNHMWNIFEKSFMDYVIKNGPLEDETENYVFTEMVTILITFFSSPFSDQTTTSERRKGIFIDLLQKVFMLSRLECTAEIRC